MGKHCCGNIVSMGRKFVHVSLKIPSVAPKRGHVMKKHDLIWYET